MKRARIAMVGFFGWGNFGDELFVETHRQMLEPEFDTWVANDLTEEPYFTKGVNSVADSSDIILIGGGDLINSARVSGLYWQEDYLRRPVVVYGLGVPRQTVDRPRVMEHYRGFLEHPNVRLVVARDVESRDWLGRQFNIDEKLHWFPDPVCAFRRPPAVPEEERVFGIVLREHRSLGSDLSAVRVMADRAKEMDYVVRHLVLANKGLRQGDLERAKQIAEVDEEVVTSEDLRVLCAEISKCTLLASIKFHGVLIAAMYGVPAIAMSVTPKNKSFLRMIERSEMLASYRDPGVADRVSRYPARIPSAVRSRLYRGAMSGYELLREVLRESVDASSRTSSPEATNRE